MIRLWRALQPSDLGIPETVKRELRSQHLSSVTGVPADRSTPVGWIAAENEMIRRLRRAQILRVQRSIRIQHFACTHLHICPCRSLHVQFLHARHVLPEVVNEYARLRLSHLRPGEHLLHPDWLDVLRFDADLLRMDDLDLLS